MLRKKKPVTILVDQIDTGFGESCPSQSVIVARDNIDILMSCVEKGDILHRKFSDQRDERYTYNWNFFAFPDNQALLERLYSDMYEIVVQGNRDKDLNYDQGEFLGYRPRDIRLFHRGGYGSYPSPISLLMSKTHEFRKKCYITNELDI